jgi:hypothetical protein
MWSASSPVARGASGVGGLPGRLEGARGGDVEQLPSGR